MRAIDPLAVPWDPRRPADVARRLAGVRVPWHVAGGWAALPAHDEGRRAWLARALDVVHPSHPWLADLRRDAA